MSVTPRPWRYQPEDEEVIAPGVAWTGDIGGIANEADGHYIVHCVNVHEELVTALRAITARYLSLAGSGDCGFWNPEEEDDVIRANAALAKAEARHEA